MRRVRTVCSLNLRPPGNAGSLYRNAEVKTAGFKRNDAGMLYLPFSFNAEKTAVEYPNFDKCLAPLDETLDKLLKAHPHIGGLVRTLFKIK